MRELEVILALVLVVLVFETFVSNRLTPTKDDAAIQQLPPGMRRLARKGRAEGTAPAPA